ncbi:Microcephalin, partial [Ophiophagus hannah]
MGAKISKTLNKQVTHVIFKDGFLSTWNRAQKAGIKLVSVLWVEKCREVGMHIDESLYPAINTNEGLPQFMKKHKCMQPKDLFGKTPEKDRRLQKRMETMVKELEMQRAATGKYMIHLHYGRKIIQTDIPILLFEDDGSLVYSPANKLKYQRSVMERRIKDMKEKRENVSPTELESNHLLNSSFANLVGSPESKNLGKKSSNCLANTENVMDVSRAELYTSSDSPSDSQYKGLKQLSGKDLYTNSILPNDKGCDFLVKKSIIDTSTTPECKDGIDWFLAIADNPLPQVKNVDHTVSVENLVHCEVTENNSSSGNDFPSIDLIDTPVTTKDSSLCKQRKYRRKSSLKLKASISHDKEPQNDFLLALLTPIKSSKDQDSSFEDCFSSNFTKNKVIASLTCQQKLQNDKEIKYNSPQSKLEVWIRINSEWIWFLDNAKFSTSDAKNTACKSLGNHMNEPDRKLKITRRIEKPLRTLVMTSMSPEMQKITLQVLKKLGGFLTSDEVCKNTSHVIAGSPRRTLNILMGIARGCWIVCYDWVLWSLEHGYWISEEPFELSVDFPAAPVIADVDVKPFWDFMDLIKDNHILKVACSVIRFRLLYGIRQMETLYHHLFPKKNNMHTKLQMRYRLQRYCRYTSRPLFSSSEVFLRQLRRHVQLQTLLSLRVSVIFLFMRLRLEFIPFSEEEKKVFTQHAYLTKFGKALKNWLFPPALGQPVCAPAILKPVTITVEALSQMPGGP